MTATERAQLWARNEYFDLQTRAEAEKLLQDEEALAMHFGTELRFGTGGLRGILGVGTAKLNVYTVARATLGLARALKNRPALRGVAIAYDSRIGSCEFAHATAAVLAHEGVPAYLFPSLAPTPMLSFAVRRLQLDAGVMITASHNPAVYNGYKVYGADGCQITDQAAKEIMACINTVSYTDPVQMEEAEARKAGLWLDVADEVRAEFVKACLACRPDPDVSTPIHVVYTPLHGTGLLPVRETLAAMPGVTVTEVASQCTMDGNFPTCPKPNPEIYQPLEPGIALCKELGAELLLATDPDCDRVGIAVRKPDGEYAHLSGNELGLLLLDYVLFARKARGALSASAVAAKTIVSSDLAFSIAKSYGVEIREVLTGFKYIGEMIGRLEAEGRESDFLFGFEESCGYLAGTHVRDKDGVMACMLVCEMAQSLKARGLSVWDALCALYARHGYLENKQLSFEISGALPMETMSAVMQKLRSEPVSSLLGRPVTQVKDYLPGIDGLPSSNVLVYMADGVKVIVRPSGTEPKVKVYLFTRAESSKEAKTMLASLESEVRPLIQP